MNDLISRQAAIASAISGRIRTLPTTEDGEDWIRVSEVRESLKAVPSAQPEITFDDVMRYCRQRCLYVIPSETFRELLGGKPMNDIKALIEELEIQYEAWGKKYSFAMILEDIEKFAKEHGEATDEVQRG